MNYLDDVERYAGPCASTEGELHTYWHLQNGQNVTCPWDCFDPADMHDESDEDEAAGCGCGQANCPIGKEAAR